MRKFFIIGLILALVFSAPKVLGYGAKGLTVPGNVPVEANMTLRGSNECNIEVNGVQFETLAPEKVLTVPNRNGVKLPVQFGIRVTNISSIPYRFIFFYLIPDIVEANGRAIHKGYARNVTKTPTESDFLLAMPGESLTFFLNADLYWHNYQLELRGYDGTGGVWTFQNLKPGTYQIHFSYENSSAIGKIDGGRTPWKFLERLWTGVVSTPLYEFQLLQL